MWRVRFWQENQVDHLRPGEAHAQIDLDVLTDGRLVDNNVEHLFTLSTKDRCLYANLRRARDTPFEGGYPAGTITTCQVSKIGTKTPQLDMLHNTPLLPATPHSHFRSFHSFISCPQHEEISDERDMKLCVPLHYA